MKALTVQQPWASLLLGIAPVLSDGTRPTLKNCENRSWSTTYRGNLLIHAGQAFDREALKFFYDGQGEERFPRGVILGMVHLDRLVPPHDDARTPWQARDHWKWMVSRPRVFSRYIPWRGQQGIFEVDHPDVLAMARAADGASTRWWDSLSDGDREWFVERVGIIEYDGGMNRLAAVHEAYACFVAMKHAQNTKEEEHVDYDGSPYFGVSESWWHTWDARADRCA